MVNNNNGSKGYFPGAYRAQPVMTRKFRYLASGSFSTDPITVGCLRVATGIMKSDTANTTAALAPCEAVRIKEVEMFGIASGGPTAFTSIELVWKGANSPVSSISATGDNVRPAHIKARPPQNSQSSWWQDFNATQTTSLLELNGPAGCVVDITLEYVLIDGSNGDVVTLAAATTAVGNYYPPLDSVSTSNTAGNGVLVPVSLVSLGLASI